MAKLAGVSARRAQVSPSCVTNRRGGGRGGGGRKSCRRLRRRRIAPTGGGNEIEIPDPPLEPEPPEPPLESDLDLPEERILAEDDEPIALPGGRDGEFDGSE